VEALTPEQQHQVGRKLHSCCSNRVPVVVVSATVRQQRTSPKLGNEGVGSLMEGTAVVLQQAACQRGGCRASVEVVVTRCALLHRCFVE
jgi:hypothetical protein